MQLKDFYTLNNLTVNETLATANITINKNHEIFKGHFPGNPVTPGVCMMQIIKEIAEKVVGHKLMMTSSSNIKFMSIINPEVTPNLELLLEITQTNDGFRVKNSTTFNDTLALKLISNFAKIG
jgi:3-hydroxyacyl-[acyl-carrier-protein] dehydratase